MTKIQRSVLFAAVCCVGSVQAGTMGSDVTLPTSAIFIAAEGGWTSNKLEGLRINIPGVGDVYSDKNTDNGSGRLSVGARRYLDYGFSASGEMGYGYYGKTHFNLRQGGPILSLPLPGVPDFTQTHFQVKNDGLDLLAGLAYDFYHVDVFFKAGAMVQNSRYNSTLNLTGLTGGGVNGAVNIDFNRTQVLPEIKLGVGYEVFKNLSITGAWMHVFGDSSNINVNIDPFNLLGTISINIKNPRLDAFLIGLEYALPV